MGSQVGRQILRGVLGGIFGGASNTGVPMGTLAPTRRRQQSR